MAQALRSVEDETPQIALVAQVNADPGLVLLDKERFNQFYEAIKAETDKLVPDLTTEKGRIEAAAKAAEEAARAQAEAAARAEREAAERAHAEALAAEKRRADEAEAARQAEADRIARETAAREAEEKAAADAAAARAADIEHRSKIMGAAKQAIMGHGVGEQTARAIVLAIAAGDVPNVSIKF